ncbi:MAG: nuclear transport factor 2 family protein [Actinomycetota bacterium]|nr:nuclear transport factor 2 family protein [Actinomycetota bacterium]
MRRLTALCLLAGLLSGCGGTARDSSREFKGDERAVAAAVEGLENAARKGDRRRICRDLLAQSLLRSLHDAGTNCGRAVRAIKDVDSYDITVDDVTVRGPQATAQVTSGSGKAEERDTLTLVREGTAWKIASLGKGGA